jgi:hypothetical protein
MKPSADENLRTKTVVIGGEHLGTSFAPAREFQR